MNWEMDIHLKKNYDPGEKELFLKARFTILLMVSVILATSATLAHTIYSQGFNTIVAVATAGILVMAAALAAMIKGKYTLAIHSIFIAGFTSLWVAMFLQTSSQTLAKLDSIVLVIGLSSAMSIAFFKNRKPIAVYFMINAVLFLIFNYHLRVNAILTPGEQLEYFFDNCIAMVFVFCVSFGAYAIHQQTLASLKDELAERKIMEKALSESRYQLSEHLKNTPVGAIFWDLNFMVTEWNPSAEQIFGYTRTEAMGKHAADLILPEDVKALVDKLFENLISGNGGAHSVNENITKTGKRILCDWYNSALKNTDGETIGAASLVNDISEKMKIQERMIQSEKMLSIGGLSAGMAHEINNPLAGMIQNAQVVHNRLAKALPANEKTAAELGISLAAIHLYAEKREVLKKLQSIMDAGMHAAQIIENMLSFSRKSDSIRKETDVPSLLDSTLALAENDHDIKKKYNFGMIKIVREYHCDLPAIFCEKSKIQQVVFNILKNACDSMNLKTYDNDTPKLTLRLNKGQNSIHIEIEDNGTGMSPEICKHIFEPFFTTKKDKGTGLGLSISYYIIVEDHCGQMEVESYPGRGTRFIIKLPVKSKTDPGAQNLT